MPDDQDHFLENAVKRNPIEEKDYLVLLCHGRNVCNLLNHKQKGKLTKNIEQNVYAIAADNPVTKKELKMLRFRLTKSAASLMVI